jgi:LPS O-antigen subunit length determinant protein (WzzB/FepE family)
MTEHQKIVKFEMAKSIDNIKKQLEEFRTEWSYELMYSKNKQEELESLISKYNITTEQYNKHYYMNFE